MATCAKITILPPAGKVEVVEYTFRCVKNCLPDADICGDVTWEKVEGDNVHVRVKHKLSGYYLQSVDVETTIQYKEGAATKSFIGTFSKYCVADPDYADVQFEHAGNAYKHSTTYEITSVTANEA